MPGRLKYKPMTTNEADDWYSKFNNAIYEVYRAGAVRTHLFRQQIDVVGVSFFRGGKEFDERQSLGGDRHRDDQRRRAGTAEICQAALTM